MKEEIKDDTSGILKHLLLSFIQVFLTLKIGFTEVMIFKSYSIREVKVMTSARMMWNEMFSFSTRLVLWKKSTTWLLLNHEICNVGVASLGTDEGAFSYILATRSWAHIRALMAEYQLASGHSLEKAIEKEFRGNEEKALLAIRKK